MNKMEGNKIQTSKILLKNPLDKSYELEEELEKCYKKLVTQIANLSESQAHDYMNAQIAQGTKQHDEVQFGLLFSVLTNPLMQTRSYRDMTFTNQDSFAAVAQKLNQLIYEKWSKLQENAAKQVIWLTSELIKNRVNVAESLVLYLLRNIAGGDLSQKNMWLAESIGALVSDTSFRFFLDKNSHLVSCVLYRLLRLLEDLCTPSLLSLRQRIASFCESLLRERWSDCATVGRDLLRLLHNVGRLPEVERLWADMIHNPSSLHPTFTGVQQLMQQRTTRKHILYLLTPEMENKMCFLVTKVKFGNHKRYQDWFLKQFLSTPESQSLRCDLIRYICVAIHPTNEQLSSDILPRWAVIGWLLSSCTSVHASSNAKLALFYDWLSYDSERDNIMNIEPGILVMYHSIRPHPQITATLLDFLCRIIPHYHPPMTSLVKQGVCRAFRTVMDKKVVQSLSPLFDNPKLDRDLQVMVRDTFSEFCIKEDPGAAVNGRRPSPVPSDPGLPGPISGRLEVRESVSGTSDIAEFSDAEDSEEENGVEEDDSLSVLERLRAELGTSGGERDSTSANELEQSMSRLEGPVREALLELQAETDRAAQCEVLDSLVQRLLQHDYLLRPAALCLAALLRPDFEERLFPGATDQESLEESLGQPLFVIFRTLCQLSSEEPSRHTLLSLLVELQRRQPKVGCYLLYFLKVSKGTEDRLSVYRDFSLAGPRGSLQEQLFSDLKVCRDNDVKLFTYLLPDLYTQFPSATHGSVELLHLVVSSIDAAQLRDLICEILQGNMVMFVKDSITSVLNASLQWETIEQHFFWQLLAAHNLSADIIMPILPRLDWSVHSEALSNLLVQLTIETPTQDLMRPLLCRPSRLSDQLTVSVIKFWAGEHEDKLSEQLSSLLLRAAGVTRKRKINPEKEKNGPSVEQILSHLEHIRLTCKNVSFLTNESLQHALSQVQATCSDAVKARFSDLLALAEDSDEESGPVGRSSGGQRAGRTLRGLPSRKALAAERAMAAAPSKSHGKHSDSSSDEDIVPRKRKKAQVRVDDDSD